MIVIIGCLVLVAQLCPTSWTVPRQAPLPIWFAKQEY